MPKGIRRALTALATFFLLYGLLGFLIIPGVGQRIANQQLSIYSRVPAQLERIEFNPFSLELTLFNLRLGQPDDEQVAFQRLYANLDWSSLWRQRLQLSEVQLEQPRVLVQLDPEGNLNLAQLLQLPESTDEAPATEDQGLFPLLIERLGLNAGSLRIQDQRPGESVDLSYQDLDIVLHDLSTLPEHNGQARLSATDASGGRIDWEGQLSLSPLASNGHLSVSQVALRQFWPYVRDAVPLSLQEGVAQLSSDYSFSLAEELELKLENIAIALAPLAIDTDQGRPLLRLENLELTDGSLDLGKRQLVIGTLRSSKLETWASREADGQLDWQKLLASPTAPAAEAQPATEQAGPPWQVLLHDAQLRGYQVHLSDRQPQRKVELLIGPLDLDLQAFDSLGTSPFRLKLDSGIGKQGKLQLQGQAQLQPISGTFAVTSTDIDLRIAQAYLEPFIRLELRSGLLASALDIDLQSVEPLAFRVSGSADVRQLHTLDTLKNRDFLKWQHLQLTGLDYRHEELLSIGSVKLAQPYARFVVNEDLTTNINELLISQGGSAQASPDSAASKPLGIHIGEITLADGSANFADFSLPQPFATAIQQLSGRIGTIDNRQSKPASVSIEGKVDRYAPVSIEGSLTPFDPLQSLDIATRFKQVELTTLTPYSGKFAGYRIRKGRLDLDLHYRIQGRQLNAENKVVLEQLQLGEKVDSPNAVDLPVKLAIALLKDTKGTISLELPIRGNLDDPQFSVMPIVWQTLRNLVLRAVQAPFKLIGGLVAGDHGDLSQVLFAPGSSELDGNARKSLDALAKGLQQRPALRLEVEGMSAAGSDGPLIAEQRLEREYRSTLYKMLQRRGDEVPADAEQLQLDDSDRAALLEGIYRSRLKQQPPAQWQELARDERTARMKQAVIDSWSGNNALLRRLSQERSANIKAYLVDQGGLQDQRVYLLDSALTEAREDGQVATALHLDSE
ncbi:hypothetical protein DNJ95_04965 [Stutzerimonas kirkiae]|uniref:AsmA domain-containing protein n=1 Tax=Stutzerimonas kirkiae TaxID=2211392 RepID=A0A4Q9RDB5_9GAMM|nr:DUF748 domain-containing protein [Stutzerimonas kirkiae]TBU97921.1 hypothetical protein DNJ96_07305 [Stutzerimonas kirkiae]TBV04563.1 hypothetical protein DNJ95_04965 [Stutzerimonas kirkiae]